MVDRNNAGRLGAGFISVCLETRWLGQNRGFYQPEPTFSGEIAHVWTPENLDFRICLGTNWTCLGPR